jgi:hypothetical protein
VTLTHRPDGVPLPTSPFGDDDGSADPGVVAALAAFGRGDGGPADVLAALAASRLLVPVVAVSEPSDDDATAEKNTHMATVTTTGRDGRRGLLAFTSVATMKRWNSQARPAPVPTRSAAEAALADGADALVIDLAGPVKFAVDDGELRALASGWRTLAPWPGWSAAEPAEQPPVSPAPTGRMATLKNVVGRAARLRRVPERLRRPSGPRRRG